MTLKSPIKEICRTILQLFTQQSANIDFGATLRNKAIFAPVLAA
jgi:hypothetical protein